MKKIIKISLYILFFGYAMGSMYSGTLNISGWQQETRGCVVVLVGLAHAVLFMFSIAEGWWED